MNLTPDSAIIGGAIAGLVAAAGVPCRAPEPAAA
jgi:hypothetical protein